MLISRISRSIFKWIFLRLLGFGIERGCLFLLGRQGHFFRFILGFWPCFFVATAFLYCVSHYPLIIKSTLIFAILINTSIIIQFSWIKPSLLHMILFLSRNSSINQSNFLEVSISFLRSTFILLPEWWPFFFLCTKMSSLPAKLANFIEFPSKQYYDRFFMCETPWWGISSSLPITVYIYIF